MNFEKKKGRTALALALAAFLALSACGSAGNDDATAPEGTKQSQEQTSEGAGSSAEKPAAPEGPLGKYDPPIEVTTVRFVNASFKYDEGKSIDDNIWTDIFKNEYGIHVKNLWTVDESQYRQKLNISIASGDIPDFMLVNKEELMRLYESDQLEDMSGVLESYGSDYLKELLNQDNGAALRAATFDGKLVGIPQTQVNGGVSTGEMIYLRYDWLKKLNLPEPKTIDDVVKIATAFAKDDPDGNGVADTYGLGMNKDLFQTHGTVKGFLNGFGAYPDMWLKGADGKLVHGSIQPETKTALQKLSELYANGVIDREFAVKDWNKVAEDVAANRLGLAYGTVSDGGHIHRANKDNNPDAEWKIYPIVSLDGSPVHPQLADTANNFYVVKKGAKHPEAIIKLANIYLEHYYLTSYAPDPNPFISRDGGIFPGKYHPTVIDPLNVNLDAFRLVQEALASGDGSHLGFPANVHFDRLTKYAAGDQEMWFSTIVFGAEGSYSVIDYYDKNKLGIYSEFQGAATPTMTEKMSSLKKFQDETFTKIIMGQASIDEFDKFVEEWKKLGGDKITEEVNASL
ncbi:extracellular solute-binding protein [Paenibacillus antri]|uniref:Extracellular solute-binding protein n=1 Tax=Paenibacillus antri TaxID=2582848 RepID=A0A5R9GKU6_9BACL|nr:extracellular solute-binding protein [Paenibacillus antri]TLS53653.1 extracellular solute-binding protein [Paenibacillus antri]